MPKILMRTTASGPDRHLHAGQVYNLSKEDAAVFLTGKSPEGGAYATLAPENAKVSKIPAQPDPEDVPADEPEDFDPEDMEEDEE